jgi:hypothetical protein
LVVAVRVVFLFTIRRVAAAEVLVHLEWVLDIL